MDGPPLDQAAGPTGARPDLPVTGLPDDPAWDEWETPVRVSAIPVLHLDGFDGPMDLLLDLAERQRIDFGRMSVLALAEQFVAALERLGGRVPIERKADWLVMATRLVLLRSRLLFPESPVAAEAAQRDAAAELRRIDELVHMRAAAAWLDARPTLGKTCSSAGSPSWLGCAAEPRTEVDVIGFLWASLALFDDGIDGVETAALYRPQWLDLHSIPEARDRILRLLAENPEGQSLDQLLPESSDETEGKDPPLLRRRSAWTSAFTASLELAKQGEVSLAQEGGFMPIHVSLGPTGPPS